MAVIAMTREMGTLGKDVAAGLAERLGLEVVHHELVENDIATRSGLGESEVRRFLGGEATLLGQWRMDRRRLSQFTAQEILELAARDNVVIRGWGATYLLRDVPHVVCVRICAPMEFRIREMMQRLCINDAAAAEREIERSDGAHNGTMQRLFGADWTDATLYAAAFNTAHIPPAQCVEQIVQLVESEPFRKTDHSRSMLAGRLIEARVRSALRNRFDNSLRAMGIDVRVEEAEVVLSGAASDERAIAELVRTAASVPGVSRVRSDIRYLSFVRN